MNANLVFKWLKDPRFAPLGSVSAPENAALEGVFLPVEIGASPIEGVAATPSRSAAAGLGPAASAQRVDITLSDGRRVLVEGPTTLSAVLGLVQGLMA
jgi:transposase